jgi:hypothetical protein|tara:strand:+ start:223 stop:408 length:186 start_codon:yes stop_codon:yes gene_type:complete
VIPILAGYGFAIVLGTAYAVSQGASAGSGYALGRKSGRIVCEKLDVLEGRIKEFIKLPVNE